MRKFCSTLYFVIMAIFVLSLSGCGGSSTTGGGRGGNEPAETQAKRMIITSRTFKKDGTSYRLFRGNQVTASGTSARYYVAPGTLGDEVTMQLEFSNSISEDLPFMITEENTDKVLFFYNPNSTSTADDTTTENVYRTGGDSQQLGYSSLTLSSAAVSFDESNVIDIVLSSNGTAKVAGTTIEPYNYVWHIDPKHPYEYWSTGKDGTDVMYSSAYKTVRKNNITEVEGVYIARDVRYTPNTLNFTTSQTAKKDQDTEYVVYYDATVDEVKEVIAGFSQYGTNYSTDKYILATLPMQNGAGGMGGEGGDPFNGGNGGQGGFEGNGNGQGPQNGMGGPNGGQNRQGASVSTSATDTSSIPSFATMTHSAEDAYNNPVLHITKAGTYKLSGKWHGQIWIDVGADSKDKVGLILNGVEVSCDVAPALVFYKVYKWAEDNGYDDQSTLTSGNLWRDIDGKMLSGDYYTPGAVVEIADRTTNTFTGANVYRILNLSPKFDDDDNLKYPNYKVGERIEAQDKMYKLDGAFHSRRTMVIGGGTRGTGTLIIKSTTCEGLDSEMHMLITGGNITVDAVDDGINVNEDNVSVFVMNDGNLTVSSENADGIDSNGWISFKGGTLNITAGSQRINSAGEAGMDAENADPYIYNASAYTWTAANGNGGAGGQTGENTGGGSDSSTSTGMTTHTMKDANGNTLAEFSRFPSASDIKVDTEGTTRPGVNASDTVFKLVHTINDFSGIR